MITSLTSRQTYAGTGTTGPFGFTFKIFSPTTDLKLTKLAVDGFTETSLTYLTDYTVVGIKVGVDAYGGGGTITLVNALAVGETLVVRRVPPNVQGLSVQNAGPFFPKGYEDQLDYLVMLVQAHEDLLARTVKLKETSDVSTLSLAAVSPVANQVLGWDATGKKIITTPGTPGPAGPSIPTFASAAARNAAFPAPGANQLVRRSDSGVEERWDQSANAWRPEGVTRAAGPIITANSKGVVGDGVNDDSVQLGLADVAAAASGGRHEIDLGQLPTRCLINSNLTLSAHFRPNPGGGKRIYVGANKTLTIAGPFDPSVAAVFDPAMPGSVSFAGNNNIRNFRAKWFGVLGNSAVQALNAQIQSGVGADDTSAIRFAIASIPDGAELQFDPGMRCRITGTIAAGSRTSIHLRGVRLGVARATDPVIGWDGVAGEGGMILQLIRCSQWVVSGLCLLPGVGNYGIDTDDLKILTTTARNALNGGSPAPLTLVAGLRVWNSDTNTVDRYTGSVWVQDAPVIGNPATGGIGTQCQFTDLTITGPYPFNPSLVELYISRNGDTNQEYHQVLNCNFGVYVGTRDVFGFNPSANNGGSITTGTNLLTFVPGVATGLNTGHQPFQTYAPGDRVQVAGAGVAGAVLDTTIASIVDNYSAHLVANASTTVANGYVIIGRHVGTGIVIGPSFNAKGIKVRDCTFGFVDAALRANGGSFHLFNNSMTGQECNVRRSGNQSEPSTEFLTNTEQSGQHLIDDCQFPYYIVGGRYSEDGHSPQKGFWQYAAQCTAATFESTHFGVPYYVTGGTVFDLTASATLSLAANNCLCAGQSMTRLGFATKTGNCEVRWNSDNQLQGVPGEGAVPRNMILSGGSTPVKIAGGGHYYPIANGWTDGEMDQNNFAFGIAAPTGNPTSKGYFQQRTNVSGSAFTRDMPFASTRKPQTKSANYSVQISDCDGVLLVDATSGNLTVTLNHDLSPEILRVTVKKIDASAHTVTVSEFHGDTIDGAATVVLTTQYQFVTIAFDGTNWWKV